MYIFADNHEKQSKMRATNSKCWNQESTRPKVATREVAQSCHIFSMNTTLTQTSNPRTRKGTIVDNFKETYLIWRCTELVLGTETDFIK